MIFLIWAGAITWLLVSGRYQTFLRPAFWSLLFVALAILVLFIIGILSHVNLHKRTSGGAVLWVKLGVFLLPLFYLIL